MFAVSGLLISGRVLEEEHLRSRIQLEGFFSRRAFRILRPSLVYLALGALLQRLGPVPPTFREWLGAALFFRSYTLQVDSRHKVA